MRILPISYNNYSYSKNNIQNPIVFNGNESTNPYGDAFDNSQSLFSEDLKIPTPPYGNVLEYNGVVPKTCFSDYIDYDIFAKLVEQFVIPASDVDLSDMHKISELLKNTFKLEKPFEKANIYIVGSDDYTQRISEAMVKNIGIENTQKHVSFINLIPEKTNLRTEFDLLPNISEFMQKGEVPFFVITHNLASYNISDICDMFKSFARKYPGVFMILSNETITRIINTKHGLFIPADYYLKPAGVNNMFMTSDIPFDTNKDW